MTLAFHLALRRVDLVNLRFDDVVGDRIISPIRKTDTEARDIEATSVDFPIHPDVRGVLLEARRSSPRVGRCPFIVNRKTDRRTQRADKALEARRIEHPAQVVPESARGRSGTDGAYGSRHDASVPIRARPQGTARRDDAPVPRAETR